MSANSINSSNSDISRLQQVYNMIITFCDDYLRVDKWSNEKRHLGFHIVLLIVATIVERVTFKMTVDRMTPYRLVLLQTILVFSMLIYGSITMLKQMTMNQEITPNMEHFPTYKLVIMGLLDVTQFAGLVVCASGVSPTMTIILLHASTPSMIIGSFFVFPDRVYNVTQIKGVKLIGLAVAVSVIRPILDEFNTTIDYNIATSTLLYTVASTCLGLATLYKEKCIIQWAQPLDIHYLSSWLFVYQLLWSLLLAPLIFFMQNVNSLGNTDDGDKNIGFPLSSFSENYGDGLRCLLGYNPDERTVNYDTSFTNCEGSILLCLLFVLSNIIVLESINVVLQMSNQVLARSMAVAVLFAFTALGVYDTEVDYGLGYWGSNIGTADLVSIVFLVWGIEIYGNEAEPNVEVLTNYK